MVPSTLALSADEDWASVNEADPYRNRSEHEPPDSDSRRIRVPLGNRDGRLAMAAASPARAPGVVLQRPLLQPGSDGRVLGN